MSPFNDVSLPIVGPKGQTGEIVHVATELGVKIYFNIRNQEFEARFGPTGDEANLHGPTLQAIVDRIRDRALVHPVAAYDVGIGTHHQRGGGYEYYVDVVGVRIVQYHKGRQYPFVVEEKSRNGQTILRSKQEVFLPTAEEIEELRQIARAMTEEDVRHRERKDHLEAVRRSKLDAIRRVSPNDLRYVQRSGEQVAELDLDVMDISPDDEFIGPEQVAAEDAANEAFVNENLDRGVDVRE